MENAVEALKMAGSVLLFVMALSIAMLSFTQARTAIDTLVKYSDREYFTIEDDNRFYYIKSTDTERYVGMETIIPTIYRVLDESYRIIFKFPDDYYLYLDKGNNKICEIDFTKDKGGISNKLDFVNGIVYHSYNDGIGNFSKKDIDNDIDKDTSRKLNDKCLHDYLVEKLEKYKVKESLGTYYDKDRKTQSDIDAGNDKDTSDVSDINKSEIRVITYTFERR